MHVDGARGASRLLSMRSAAIESASLDGVQSVADHGPRADASDHRITREQGLPVWRTGTVAAVDDQQRCRQQVSDERINTAWTPNRLCSISLCSHRTYAYLYDHSLNRRPRLISLEKTRKVWPGKNINLRTCFGVVRQHAYVLIERRQVIV